MACTASVLALKMYKLEKTSITSEVPYLCTQNFHGIVQRHQAIFSENFVDVAQNLSAAEGGVILDTRYITNLSNSVKKWCF